MAYMLTDGCTCSNETTYHSVVLIRQRAGLVRILPLMKSLGDHPVKQFVLLR